MTPKAPESRATDALMGPLPTSTLVSPDSRRRSKTAYATDTPCASTVSSLPSRVGPMMTMPITAVAATVRMAVSIQASRSRPRCTRWISRARAVIAATYADR